LETSQSFSSYRLRPFVRLSDLPVGTTIFFLYNGKERYLRKAYRRNSRETGWYSREMDDFVPDYKVPSNWRVMRF